MAYRPNRKKYLANLRRNFHHISQGTSCIGLTHKNYFSEEISWLHRNNIYIYYKHIGVFFEDTGLEYCPTLAIKVTQLSALFEVCRLRVVDKWGIEVDQKYQYSFENFQIAPEFILFVWKCKEVYLELDQYVKIE